MNRLPIYSSLCLLLICLVGCHSAPAPEPSANPAAQTAAATPQTPPVKPPPAPVKPPPTPEPQVDQDSPGGVRGPITLKFFVSLAGNPVQSAHLTVRNGAGKQKAKGDTNNWGEFHTSLFPGKYKVAIDWQGKTQIQSILIDLNSQEIDLKLDAPA